MWVRAGLRGRGLSFRGCAEPVRPSADSQADAPATRSIGRNPCQLNREFHAATSCARLRQPPAPPASRSDRWALPSARIFPTAISISISRRARAAAPTAICGLSPAFGTRLPASISKAPTIRCRRPGRLREVHGACQRRLLRPVVRQHGPRGAQLGGRAAKRFQRRRLFHFNQVDADPGILFVARDSRLQTIDDIIAEGKKRSLNVGVSRLAHPASLGALAVARHAGVEFNLVPLSGGRNTIAGIATGEMDFGALPTGVVVAALPTIEIE